VCVWYEFFGLQRVLQLLLQQLAENRGVCDVWHDSIYMCGMARLWCRASCKCWIVNTLQHTVAHCNTLQRAATRCNKGKIIYIFLIAHIFWAFAFFVCQKSYNCNTLWHTATNCNTLQHTATHCNTLQHIATHGNKLQHTMQHNGIARLATARLYMCKCWIVCLHVHSSIYKYMHM